MNLIIREISTEYAEAISNLSDQLGYQSTLQKTETHIQEIQQHKDHCGFVAVADEKIIGWIHAFYTFRLESDAFVEIGGMVVDHHFRRKGIGQKLVEQVKKWSLERSVSKIRVRCNTNRLETHQFYQALGFNETKEQKVLDQLI